MYFNREEPPSGSVNNPLLLLLLLLLLLSSVCGAGKKRPRARKMRELFAQRTSKFFSALEYVSWGFVLFLCG